MGFLILAALGWRPLAMWRLLLVLALAGCSQAAEPEVPAQKSPTRMQEAARKAAAQPPKRSVYRFDTGELVVLDIATIGPRGYGDSQKCFLWRDTQFGTASLQCPGTTEADITLPASADSGPNY